MQGVTKDRGTGQRLSRNKICPWRSADNRNQEESEVISVLVREEMAESLTPTH